MWNCGISLKGKELLPNCSLNEKSWKSLQAFEDTLVIDSKGSAAPNLSHLPPVSRVIHSGSFNFCNFVDVSQVHSSALLLCLVLVTHFYLLVVLRVEMLTVKEMLRWNLSKNKFINPAPLPKAGPIPISSCSFFSLWLFSLFKSQVFNFRFTLTVFLFVLSEPNNQFPNLIFFIRICSILIISCLKKLIHLY